MVVVVVVVILGWKMVSGLRLRYNMVANKWSDHDDDDDDDDSSPSNGDD